MTTQTIKITKPSEIRRLGTEALVKAIGPIGMARYLDMTDEEFEAKKRPVVFDEDSTELSPAMYKAFKSSVIQRNRKKNA